MVDSQRVHLMSWVVTAASLAIAFTSALYLVLYFVTGVWNLLLGIGAMGITLIGLWFIRHLIRNGEFNAAGYATIATITFNFVTAEILWEGIGLIMTLAAVTLILVTASILLRDQPVVWFVGIAILIVCMAVANEFSPIAYELNQNTGLGFIVPGTISLSVMIILWKAINLLRLGSIGGRLLAVFATLVFIPTVIITASSGWLGMRNGQQQLLNQLESVVTLKEAEISIWLETQLTDLSLAQGNVGMQSTIHHYLNSNTASQADLDNIRQHLQWVRSNTNNLQEIFLANRNGVILVSTNPMHEGQFVRQQTFFQKSLQGPVIEPPTYDISTGQMTLFTSRPIKDEAGNVLGVMAGRSSLDKLSQIMSERTGLGETGLTSLVGANRILISSGRTDAPTRPGVYIRTKAVNDTIKSRQNGEGVYENEHGELVIGVYHWLPDLQMILLAEQARAEATASTYTTLGINAFVAMLALLLTVGSGMILTRGIVSPLTDLVDTVKKISAGDRAARAPEDRTDEIGVLSQSFNMMIEAVQYSEEALRRESNLIARIMETSPVGIMMINQAGDITFVNSRVADLFGVPRHTLTQHPYNDQLWTITDFNDQPLTPEADPILTVLRTGESIANQRYAIHTASGARFLLSVNAAPLLNENDEIDGLVATLNDITEQMRIEEMVIQSEKMLSVGGLAAGMAHEINNPLAGILQNMQVIRNRFSPDLRKNQRVAQDLGTEMTTIEGYINARNIPAMFDAIMDSGKRAAQIVQNMLSFSRKETSSAAPNDLIKLLDDTIALAANDYDLKKKYDFRDIKIVRHYQDNLPNVPCEHTKIQQVFLNILKNGAEAMNDFNESPHCPANWHPTFTLYAHKTGDMVEIEIVDNGPGMDETTRKKVFEPFFTTKDIGIGTGLGLSVSYFIITENHDGELHVESSPNQGTSFAIKLPLRQQKDVSDET